VPEDEYLVDLNFHRPIVPAETKISFTATSLVLFLRKEVPDEKYWPRLRLATNDVGWLQRDETKASSIFDPGGSGVQRIDLSPRLQWVDRSQQDFASTLDGPAFVSINTPGLGRPPPVRRRLKSMDGHSS
jgi:hypothetical protein